MTKQLPHIVIVNDFAHINGGASQVALASAVALADRGYAVSLITAVVPIMPELTRKNLAVYCTNQHEILKDPSRLRASFQGLWNSQAATQMAKVLNNLDPRNTIIHLHGWTKALSSSVVRVALRRKFKVICTLHDYFLACPNGGFFDYQQNTICHLKPLSKKCVGTNCDARSYAQKLWRCSRQIMQRYFAHMPSAIKYYIAVSDFSSEILKPFLPKDATIYHINNPIEIQKQLPIDVMQNSNFVYVGRLAKEKGASLFATAARQLNINAQFIGDGYCKEEIAKIYPAAVISGWVSHDTMLRLLQTARVLVLPSLWYETQGLVVLEAAALGIPAVVPDTSAAREFVIDGVTGLWFKGGNVDDLIQKIRMLQNNEMVKTMGQKAYDNYWLNPFAMKKHLESLEVCYHQMLQENK